MDTPTLKTASGYLVATFLATTGLTTIFNPSLRSKNFGVPATPTDKAALAYLQPMGARELSLGLIIGMLMYKGEQKSAGMVTLIALVIPAMDAWAVWRFNGRLKEAWSHVFGAGVVGLAGLWLAS
ncbi:hypothetical protein BDR22DRAFT_835552 [Usnea florida]